QAEAILNMRLRSLRRLEEMELVRERDALRVEREEILELLGSEGRQWDVVSQQLKETKKTFGKNYEGGARRTQFSEATEIEDVPLEAMIEREPLTIVCSKMGWIRAMKGHIALDQTLKFKDGDEGRFIFHAETTDRILVFGNNGRFYTIGASTLPGGRGMGEPLRLMVDLPNETEIVDLFVHKPEDKLLVASTAGDGFIVAQSEIVAQTRTGKQVLNVKGDDRAVICEPVTGDHVAIVSQNRRLLVFPVTELPEMGRGKGVRLQKYNMARGKQGVLELDGGMSDITTFDYADGLSWTRQGGGNRTESDMSNWLGKRASVGKTVPHGFPRDNKFS
ncbi:MAG: DNA gyrase C-terminal beta-propeller domain-containing protein, partial [Pseudoruegeria sp.]